MQVTNVMDQSIHPRPNIAMSEESSLIKFTSAPQTSSISIDLDGGKMFTDKNSEEPSVTIDLTVPGSFAMTVVNNDEDMKPFYGSMGQFMESITTNKVAVDRDTGELIISPSAMKSDLIRLSVSLAGMAEKQEQESKAVKIWMGEAILDYIAKAPYEITIDEAIEQLGFLERASGIINWKPSTLARWPAIVQRIPHNILRLPIPQSYLAEAALTKAPEGPIDKIKFNNARDALLVHVSQNRSQWSKSKFVSCMKELQDAFKIARSRGESVSLMYERLVQLYRLRHEAHMTGNPTAYYQSIGLGIKDVANWIYNIEAELISKEKLEPDPKDQIPANDGLSAAARQRIADAQQSGKLPIEV